MKIEKEIEITTEIDLDADDIREWMEESIGNCDLLYTDEYKEKMKAVKAKYYEKWMEIYWFLKNPYMELEGNDPMPPQSREDAKRYFL